MPKSRSQLDLLIETIQDNLNTDNEPRVWVGLDDLDQENVFVWNDGTPLTWSHWVSIAPNNQGGQDCVVLKEKNNDFAWNDIMCDVDVRYVCETGD